MYNRSADSSIGAAVTSLLAPSSSSTTAAASSSKVAPGVTAPDVDELAMDLTETGRVWSVSPALRELFRNAILSKGSSAGVPPSFELIGSDLMQLVRPEARQWLATKLVAAARGLGLEGAGHSLAEILQRHDLLGLQHELLRHH